MPRYKLLRRNLEFLLQDEHLKSFNNIKQDLLKATETTVLLAKPGQQYVILCDASCYSGLVVMIQDYLKQKDRKKNSPRHCILRITII